MLQVIWNEIKLERTSKVSWSGLRSTYCKGRSTVVWPCNITLPHNYQPTCSRPYCCSPDCGRLLSCGRILVRLSTMSRRPVCKMEMHYQSTKVWTMSGGVISDNMHSIKWEDTAPLTFLTYLFRISHYNRKLTAKQNIIIVSLVNS